MLTLFINLVNIKPPVSKLHVSIVFFTKAAASACENIIRFILGSVSLSGLPSFASFNQSGMTEPLLCATLAKRHTANLLRVVFAWIKQRSMRYLDIPYIFW